MYVGKTGTQGAIHKSKRGRAAKRGARAKMSAPTLPLLVDASPLSEKDVRSAVALLIQAWHAGASREEWPEIAKAIADQVRCDTRIVTGVLDKLAEGTPPENRREGGGRKNRIVMGSENSGVHHVSWLR